MTLRLDRTRAALMVYDAGLPRRDRLLADARNDREMRRWQAAEDAAVRRVQRAFFADTADRNSLGNCFLVNLTWLRKLCAKPGGTHG